MINKYKQRSKILPLVLACSVLLTSCQTVAVSSSSIISDDSTSYSENGKVSSTINAYFNGRRNADLVLLKKAFSNKARLSTIGAENKVKLITLDKYFKVVENKGPVKVTTVINHLRVKDKLAFAEVVFQYSDKSYTDYLILLKTSNGWKIISKTFIKN